MAIMTKDWEAFQAIAYSKATPWSKSRCKVGELLDSLEDDRRSLVVSVIEDAEVSGSTLHAALRQIGYRGGRTSVHEHRRQTCPCYRGTE